MHDFYHGKTEERIGEEATKNSKKANLIVSTFLFTAVVKKETQKL